ncbi:MAG TPA: hypothetical protein VGK48_02435, partial [Terriglobia bacterium]
MELVAPRREFNPILAVKYGFAGRQRETRPLWRINSARNRGQQGFERTHVGRLPEAVPQLRASLEVLAVWQHGSFYRRQDCVPGAGRDPLV